MRAIPSVDAEVAHQTLASAALATTRRKLTEINDALSDAAAHRGIRHLIEF